MPFADKTEQLPQNMRLISVIQQKEKYKWKEALPVAFGPYQVESISFKNLTKF